MKYFQFFLVFTIFYFASTFSEVTEDEVHRLPLKVVSTSKDDWQCFESNWGIIRRSIYKEEKCSDACETCSMDFEACRPPSLDFMQLGFLKTYVRSGMDFKKTMKQIQSGAPLALIENKDYCYCQRKGTKIPYVDVKTTLLNALKDFRVKLSDLRQRLNNLSSLLVVPVAEAHEGDKEDLKSFYHYFDTTVKDLMVWSELPSLIEKSYQHFVMTFIEKATQLQLAYRWKRALLRFGPIPIFVDFSEFFKPSNYEGDWLQDLRVLEYHLALNKQNVESHQCEDSTSQMKNHTVGPVMNCTDGICSQNQTMGGQEIISDPYLITDQTGAATSDSSNL